CLEMRHRGTRNTGGFISDFNLGWVATEPSHRSRNMRETCGKTDKMPRVNMWAFFNPMPPINAFETSPIVKAIDHYVEPHYLLGNIAETDRAEMVVSPKQRKF